MILICSGLSNLKISARVPLTLSPEVCVPYFNPFGGGRLPVSPPYCWNVPTGPRPVKIPQTPSCSGIEVTSLEVSTPLTTPDMPSNPWLDTAGLFADDDTLELMLQEIYAERVAERLAA